MESIALLKQNRPRGGCQPGAADQDHFLKAAPLQLSCCNVLPTIELQFNANLMHYFFHCFQRLLSDVEKQAETSWPQKGKKRSGIKVMWRKFLMVAPYLWPTGKPALQFFVISSFVILAVIRFISVLIPIYYKKIGE